MQHVCRNHVAISEPAQLDLPGSLIFQEGKCIEGDYYIVWPSDWQGRCHVSLLHVLTFSITFLAFVLVTSLLCLVIWHLCAWHAAMLASLTGNMVACGSLAVDMVSHAHQIF